MYIFSVINIYELEPAAPNTQNTHIDMFKRVNVPSTPIAL